MFSENGYVKSQARKYARILLTLLKEWDVADTHTPYTLHIIIHKFHNSFSVSNYRYSVQYQK